MVSAPAPGLPGSCQRKSHRCGDRVWSSTSALPGNQLISSSTLSFSCVTIFSSLNSSYKSPVSSSAPSRLLVPHSQQVFFPRLVRQLCEGPLLLFPLPLCKPACSWILFSSFCSQCKRCPSPSLSKDQFLHSHPLPVSISVLLVLSLEDL